MSQIMKLALEMGPLLVFFISNAKFGILTGTLAFVIATTIALLASWVIARRVPMMPMISGVFVLVFGGLTVILADEMFIKIKPTLVNLLFAGALTFGYLTRRNYLQLVLGSAFSLTEQGWRTLTVRWAVFFVVLAVLNEVVWRSVPTDSWVDFKVFGILPLTIVFSLTQVPLLLRHAVPENTTPEGEDKPD
ncbi:septation protein A [Insolitispirillum peregrinum]|nr:septation protein A [Insolitispirillum peregrinum]